MSTLTLLAARDKYGVSLFDIKEGMRLAETEDPDLGARYWLANTLAVNIRYDRHAWNLRRAEMYKY